MQKIMQKIMFKLLLSLALACGWAASTPAQVKLGPQDAAKLPPADLNRISAGVEAPDFILADQDGKPVQLASFRGKQTVVLVFYRGYW